MSYRAAKVIRYAQRCAQLFRSIKLTKAHVLYLDLFVADQGQQRKVYTRGQLSAAMQSKTRERVLRLLKLGTRPPLFGNVTQS